MASLDGLVCDWDACDVLRERMRVHKTLFLPEPRMSETRATVSCADRNVEVLKPLVQRLTDPTTGQVGMLTVPDLEKQTFSIYSCKVFFGWHTFGDCAAGQRVSYKSVYPSLTRAGTWFWEFRDCSSISDGQTKDQNLL